MKSSPLLLKWVVYPLASYETLTNESTAGEPPPTKLTAEVRYSLQGEHVAILRLETTDDKVGNCKFAVEAVGAFSVDAERVKEAYKMPAPALPVTVAVNVARILYSAARELISTFTARSPTGSVLLESVLIEPDDVKIASDASPQEIISKVFGGQFETAATESTKQESAKPVVKRRRGA